MEDWHSEEEIKAQLRELTRQMRKLRRDLDDMIGPNESRRGVFRHRRLWTTDAPPPVANDRRKRKR